MSSSDERFVEFKAGCMWEGDPWYIVFDSEVPRRGEVMPCPHCHSPSVEVTTRSDGSSFETSHAVCPRVVVAKNEAGYNSTGVCLDCILEAAASLNQGGE